MRSILRVVAFGMGSALFALACGGTLAPGGQTKADYQEYTCPDPIGKIVREDCSKSALQYQGTSFEGSVGASGIGASASYRQNAIREADSLVQLLKEQRVSLCNNFNTCKLTTKEYRDDQKHLDDSFVALMALKDRMAQIDAEGAAKLLAEIQSIRNGNSAKSSAPAATPAPTTAAPTTAQPAPSAAPAATVAPTATAAAAAYTCKGPALLLFKRGTIAGPAFGYDKTRDVLKDHPELKDVEFVEFLLESDTLSGKKQDYILVGVSPDRDTMKKLREVIKTVNATAGGDIACPTIAPTRKLNMFE